MININLDIKTKIKETTKGMLLEIGEYETWFPKENINTNKNQLLIKIFEDWNYKLGKKSITNNIESIKGSEILKYIKNISNININENELIPCNEQYNPQYNGYYIGKINNKDCFKYNITWEKNRKSFKINNPYKENDLVINYIVTPIKDISTHNEKIFYLNY